MHLDTAAVARDLQQHLRLYAIVILLDRKQWQCEVAHSTTRLNAVV
jgi:hypothetical protein